MTHRQEPQTTNPNGSHDSTPLRPVATETGADPAAGPDTAVDVHADDDGDVDVHLMETAAIVLAQLQIIRECSGVERPSGAIVVEIVEHAESLAVVTPDAIGAVGVLVGAMRSDDDIRLAHLLTSLRSTFGDDELLRAAAALLAASTSALAEAIGAAPVRLQDELHGGARTPRTQRPIDPLLPPRHFART